MDEKTAMVQMAARLVRAMEPEEAKEKLLAIVCGGEIYETILNDGTAPVPKERKKRGPRRKKVVLEQGPIEKPKE